MEKPDLTPCIEILVMEAHVVCSNNANKIPAGDNFLYGWLLSRHMNSCLSFFALTTPFFRAVAAGCGTAFTLLIAFFAVHFVLN